MIGIYGGAFDPVHLGHLALAKVAQQSLMLDKVIFVPLGVPPHRPQPLATARQRISMLTAAIKNEAAFAVDTTEIEKAEPSWTVKTLEYFKQVMPGETLCLLLGSDAFKPINSWYRWRSILDYSHMLIVSRQGDEREMDEEVFGFLNTYRASALTEIKGNDSGKIYWLEADIPDISSTQVREAVKARKPLDRLLPDGVKQLIESQGLYA